jgi:hypothetical protein
MSHTYKAKYAEAQLMRLGATAMRGNNPPLAPLLALGNQVLVIRPLTKLPTWTSPATPRAERLKAALVAVAKMGQCLSNADVGICSETGAGVDPNSKDYLADVLSYLETLDLGIEERALRGALLLLHPPHHPGLPPNGDGLVNGSPCLKLDPAARHGGVRPGTNGYVLVHAGGRQWMGAHRLLLFLVEGFPRTLNDRGQLHAVMCGGLGTWHAAWNRMVERGTTDAIDQLLDYMEQRVHAVHLCHNRTCCNPRHLAWALGAKNRPGWPQQGKPGDWVPLSNVRRGTLNAEPSAARMQRCYAEVLAPQPAPPPLTGDADAGPM